jgi:HK97 family phage prohead protease
MEKRLTIAAPTVSEPNDQSNAIDEQIAGKLVGYGAVFYRPYDPGSEYNLKGNIWERISPHAFDRTLREKNNIRILFNHSSDQLLGTTGDGSATVRVNEVGLLFEVKVADTQVGRDVVKLVRRKSIPGCSFMFGIVEESWSKEGDKIIVTIEDVDLWECGPVTFPAYESTPIVARDIPAPVENVRFVPVGYNPRYDFINHSIEDEIYGRQAVLSLARRRQLDRDLLQIEN